VYLAGPDVFAANSAELGAAKKEICEQHGFEGLYPGDVPTAVVDSANALSLFEHLVEMLERADLIIANMTPFRGVSMDVGTAVEIGYMHARGRPVFGYTNVTSDYAERVGIQAQMNANHDLIGPDGMVVEPFGFVDNLMCVAPVLLSGSTVVRRDASPHQLFRDLSGFEACVREAARLLGV
jgi:nucleoside 2-deoxyribosyltransferase